MNNNYTYWGSSRVQDFVDDYRWSSGGDLDKALWTVIDISLFAIFCLRRSYKVVVGGCAINNPWMLHDKKMPRLDHACYWQGSYAFDIGRYTALGEMADVVGSLRAVTGNEPVNQSVNTVVELGLSITGRLLRGDRMYVLTTHGENIEYRIDDGALIVVPERQGDD